MADDARVERSMDPGDSRVALTCLYAFYGLGGGLVLLLVVGLLSLGIALVVGSVRTGEYGTLALVVVLALVGGPVSVLYLVAAFADAEKRPAIPFLQLGRKPVARGRVVVAVIFGAVADLALVSTEIGLLLLVAVVLPALALAVGVRSSSGELDAERGTLRITQRAAPDRTADLNELAGYRRFDAGSVVLFWFSYEESYGGLTAPLGVAVPPDVASAVERAIEAGVDADDGTDSTDANETDALVRYLLVGFGLLFVGLALSLGFLGSKGFVGNLLSLLFPARILCLFGGIFFLAAHFQRG